MVLNLKQSYRDPAPVWCFLSNVFFLGGEEGRDGPGPLIAQFMTCRVVGLWFICSFPAQYKVESADCVGKVRWRYFYIMVLAVCKVVYNMYLYLYIYIYIYESFWNKAVSQHTWKWKLDISTKPLFFIVGPALPQVQQHQYMDRPGNKTDQPTLPRRSARHMSLLSWFGSWAPQ